MATETLDDLFARYGPAYRWLAAGTSMVGAMTVVLSMTTVNVAFPDIMGAFGIGRDKAQLLSSGYFAAMTAGMVLAASLITIMGERVTYALMLVLFSVGSMMSGAAETELALNSGRLLQGVAAGVVQPLTLAVTFKVFPPERRGTAMGLYSMGIVFAPAIGPTLGGIAIEWFDWRYVFFLTLPSAMLAAVLGFLFMPTKKIERRFPDIDYFGLGLLCSALFTLMLALSSGQREGWGSDGITALFAVGGSCAVAFIVWEHYAEKPLLNMALFRYGQFAAASVVAFFSGCVFLSSTFLIPVFVQEIQGFTPLRAGWLLMPGGLSLLLLFPLAGRISDLVAPQIIICAALCSYIVAFVLFAQADVNTPFWTLVSWSIFIRIGLAFTTPVVNATALKAVPADLVNQASGGISLLRQLGAAFGMSCVVAFLEARIPFHRDAFLSAHAEAQASSAQMLSVTRRLLSESGVPEAFQGVGAVRHLGQMLYAQASTMGYQDAFMALAILSACGLVPTAVLALWRQRVAARADA
ncbi:MAG: DHA2 family efflux MFS transporter permease subunit [Gammaproteobacteria bacterium]|nr:DHA2 family efflux MFS transporter permease subunit [Gammaproteobacteria bacterium]